MTLQETIDVAALAQWDDPCRERAKMQISEFLRDTERGQWLLNNHFSKLDWTLEHDGGSERSWWVSVSVRLEPVWATYYCMRWPDVYRD